MPQAYDEAGNIWEVDAQGNPLRLVSQGGAPQQGKVFTLPQNPRDVAESQRRDRKDAEDAARQARRDELAQMQFKADLAKNGLELGPDGTIRKASGQTGGTQGVEIDQAALKRAALESMTRQLQDVESQFNQNFYGDNDRGVWEFLPSATNRAFDAAGAGLTEQALGAFRVPGVGAQSDAELRAFQDANQVSSDNLDATNIQRLKNIRNRLNAQRVAMGLPEIPDGITTQNNKAPAGNPLDNAFAQTVAPMQAAGFGATNQTVPLPPEMNAENAAYLAQNAGRLDPQAYAQFRAQLDAKYGFNPPDAAALGAFVKQANDYYNGGGRTFGAIPNPEKPMSALEQGRNNLVNNPLGGLAAGITNAGSFGGVEALTGDKMDALRDARPFSTMGGEVLGAIAATKGLGMGGNALASRIPTGISSRVPTSLNNPFVRNLAADATYGGIYGGVTEGDPLQGAAVGGVASALGQGVGKGLGAALGGIDMTPAAALLRSKGVSLTAPQAMGGFAKRFEDRMAGYPVIGDMINARRVEGFQDFNRAAMNEAGAPIGATTRNVGQQGLDDLYSAAGNAYDNATAGVTVPLDAQFPQDLAAIGAKSRMLPPDLNTRFSAAMDNAVQPIAIGQDMTGDAYQQAMRGLKGYKAEMTKPGFEQDYRDLLSQAQDALKGQMIRGGGQATTDGLAKADQSYRMAKTLERAVAAAKNGTGTGELQVFTPAQLNSAAYAAAKKYPGPRPFADLADNAQEVMPSSIPDSGTAGRIAAMLLPGALGGSAVGADSLGWDGAAKGLALTGLLAAGGTKTGQKALQKLLFDRPDTIKLAGRAVSKRKGLFGSAAVPLLLEAGN